MIEPRPVCVDDFGMSVYVCHYTQKIVWADNVVFVGAEIPGVKAKYVMSKAAQEARVYSAKAFHESEANCNTCAHLMRVKHQKDRAGFLRGVCGNGKSQWDASPYATHIDGNVMRFHPDDPMHMPCYLPRGGYGIENSLHNQ